MTNANIGMARMDRVSHQEFDRRALAVGQAVYEALEPEAVILFGSRARGDYRADSDIDLMLIVGDNSKNPERERAAHDVASETVRRIYGHLLHVDVVQYTARQFDDELPSINRLASRVAEYGITLDGNRMAHQRLHYDDDARREEVALRLYDAEEHCATLELVVAAGRGDQVVGYNAQQTIEHTLKALTAALGGRYSTTHELQDLMAEVRATERAAGRALGIDLPEHLAWLSAYARGSKYDPKPQPIEDRQGLLETVCGFQRVVAERLRSVNDP
ncbi:MAG: HEPN domain-containing protein [Chloroflexota bacterium]|nr:HEPN domain-containing protein [Chloroflexota bacterium]MDE2959884.1 HEPN domain-containing protein [Chloroflexota bacterium]